MNRVLYQTLCKRDKRCNAPGLCKKSNAWLGKGYYFWLNEDDAIRWGLDSKYYTRKYEIYKSEIFFDNILNTVFDEGAYNFFVEIIEEAAKIFIKKTNKRPTIKRINDYFNEKGVWAGVDGILFQDLPKSETYGLVQNLYYKKRIQLVVYNKQVVISFVYHSGGECLDD